MDELRCQDFFLQPSHMLHRRYEALRAYFVDHRPLPDVARQYGYSYGTLRNLLTEFRQQYRTGQVPPFSPLPNVDDHMPTPPPHTTQRQNCQTWPTAANWLLLPVDVSVPA